MMWDGAASGEGSGALLLHTLQWLQRAAHPQSRAGREPPAAAALQTPWPAGCFPAGVGNLIREALPAEGLLLTRVIFLSCFLLGW